MRFYTRRNLAHSRSTHRQRSGGIVNVVTRAVEGAFVIVVQRQAGVEASMKKDSTYQHGDGGCALSKNRAQAFEAPPFENWWARHWMQPMPAIHHGSGKEWQVFHVSNGAHRVNEDKGKERNY